MRGFSLFLISLLFATSLQLRTSSTPDFSLIHTDAISSLDSSQPETSNSQDSCSPCSLTLITGDQFFIWADPTGRILNVATAQSWPSETRGYLMAHLGKDSYLIPASADMNRIDLRFFDLSYLIENGYQKLSYLPVIQQASNSRFRPLSIPLGVASSVSSERAAFSSTPSPRVSEYYETFLKDPSIVRLFLDGMVGIPITLDQALPQLFDSAKYYPQSYSDNGTGNGLIGADSAWLRGYTGKNVKVALLDTGIWKRHPDFFNPSGMSKIIYEADYTNDQNVTDYFGHGTWTASILAGSGGSSRGLFSGTAPGVQLLNIKVLNHAGFGYDSWVLAGIQDAINQKADIISMSLGGSPDPIIDEAVKNATDSGIIVVSAAGNSGPSYFSIGSPAEAPSGLAVGASSIPDWFGSPPGESQVWFSSNGPSYAYNLDGSSIFPPPAFSIKPNLVAPGWQVVGARAPDSILGGLVNNIPSFDGNYFALSGTSASTPHASGAIAILKQAFPNWSSQLIIDDLVSTGTLLNQGWFDGDKVQLGCCGIERANSSYPLDVYQQGGGRINLTAALSPSLIVTPSDLRLSVEKSTTVTIYNPSDSYVSFDLRASIKDLETGADASSLLKLSTTSVYLAPGSSFGVNVAIKARSVATSYYGGYILAVTPGISQRILAHGSIGFYKLNYLTIQANDPVGQPMNGGLALVAMQNLTWFGFSFYTPFLAPLDASGMATVPVLDGVNTVLAATANCGSSICGAYASGIVDVEGSNSSLLLESRNDYPVTFQPDPAKSSILTIFSDFRLPSFTLTTPYGAVEWDFGIGIGITGPDLQGVTIYAPTTNEANALRVAYEYTPTDAPVTPTVYYPAYEFNNIHTPLRIVANIQNMVMKEGRYRSAPLVFTKRQLVASSPILGAEGGFGDSFIVGLPSNVTLVIGSQWQYVDTQWYPDGRFRDANIVELFVTGAPRTQIFDDFGLRPYYPAALVYPGTSLSRASRIGYQLGPLLSSSTSPGWHFVSSRQATGSLYLNGSLRDVRRDLTSPYEGVITSIQGRTKVTLLWNAGAGLWFTNYFALNVTFWADGSAGKQGSTWVSPPSIVSLRVSDLDSSNIAASGQTVVQITTSTSSMAPESTLELEYSTNHGIQWTAASPPVSSGSYLHGSNSLTDYLVRLPDIHYLPVSLRIHLSNGQGGQTTMTLLNAFASKDYPNSKVEILSPQDGTFTITKKIAIQGHVVSPFLYPVAPPPLRISDARFTVSYWNDTDGRFTLTNTTRINPGAANLTVTFTDIYRRSSSATLLVHFKASFGPRDAAFSLLLETIPSIALSFIALRFLFKRSLLQLNRNKPNH